MDLSANFRFLCRFCTLKFATVDAMKGHIKSAHIRGDPDGGEAVKQMIVQAGWKALMAELPNHAAAARLKQLPSAAQGQDKSKGLLEGKETSEQEVLEFIRNWQKCVWGRKWKNDDSRE